MFDLRSKSRQASGPFVRSRWLVLAAAPLLAAGSFAAVPVVESEGVVPGAQPASAAPAATSPAPASRRLNVFPQVQAVDSAIDARIAPTPGRAASADDRWRSDAEQSQGNGELVYQLQLLQQEVQTLRGQVEEQAYRLKRFEQQQKKQYLGLDQRMQELAAASVPATADADTGADARDGEATPPRNLRRPVVADAAEQQAYMAAFELTQDKQFEEAISAFDGLLQQFPDGTYAANSLYWLGELYLALPEANLERSRQAFVQVVGLHPAHDKVPDALYKLGTLYDRLGDREKAIEYLDRVEKEHPATAAARLGKTYRQQWAQ